MKIKEWLKGHEQGAVLADSDGVAVRLWCGTVPHQTLRALRKFFPVLERRESFLRLGGFPTLVAGIAALAEAKMTSASLRIQNLHLVEGRDGEGMRTIPPHLIS